MPTFDPEALNRLIDEYRERLPQIFRKHNRTQKLLSELLQGLQQNNMPFTVAVCGLMKAGKSSLLNTLVGQDLAVTGVSEATATINWFKYRAGANADTFRVIWKDKPEEDIPLSEIAKWVGNSDYAAQTHHLEFFADAEFLKQAHVVDTPGADTTTSSNETTAQGFLSQQKEGEKADAIIYVLGVVARINQEEMLKSFQSNSRIAGAAPYNSVAVVHRWETLNEADPYQEAQRKAGIIKETFREYVADILPVSAPLGWAAEHFDEGFWQYAFELGSLPKKELEDILEDDQTFDEVREHKEWRAKYTLPRSKFPWACLRVIINRVSLANLQSPKELQEDVSRISGIGELKSMLDKRFFSRAKMIRSFGVIAKTLPLCDRASLELSNLERELEDKNRKGEAAFQAAKSSPSVVQEYIKDMIQSDTNRLTLTADVLAELGKATQKVRDEFHSMNQDIKFCDQLDLLDAAGLQDWKPKLSALFGQYGMTLEERIKLFDGKKSLIQTIGELKRLHVTGKPREIIDHAIEQLGEIVNTINTQC